jgi:hypothetical protein
MDREQIIQWAREAGFTTGLGSPMLDKLEDFANLAADHEREACASIADKYADNVGDDDIGASIAVDIRARGQDA